VRSNQTGGVTEACLTAASVSIAHTPESLQDDEVSAMDSVEVVKSRNSTSRIYVFQPPEPTRHRRFISSLKAEDIRTRRWDSLRRSFYVSTELDLPLSIANLN
jgi:hypothetical protein